MRKRFPAPKGLGSRSFADRYASNRRDPSSRRVSKKETLKKFLSSKKTIDLSGTSIKTTRSGWSLLIGIFVTSLVLGIVIVATN